MRKVVLRLQKPVYVEPGNTDPLWLVCDQPRSINAYIAQSDIPTRIIRDMAYLSKAYFEATMDDSRPIFGRQVKGAW